jgi:hypothetical protein
MKIHINLPPNWLLEESPLGVSCLRRLGTQILKAAAIVGSVLVHLLVMAFYLEISLLKSLNRLHANQLHRRHEIEPSVFQSNYEKL